MAIQFFICMYALLLQYNLKFNKYIKNALFTIVNLTVNYAGDIRVNRSYYRQLTSSNPIAYSGEVT